MMNAFIVDDDPVVRMLASKMLEVKGYAVSLASDEESLKKYISSSPSIPDLCLVDLQIGDMSGVEAIAILQEAFSDSFRIICMSSHAPHEAEDLFPQLLSIRHANTVFDFDKDFLQKPFQSGSLYSLL